MTHNMIDNFLNDLRIQNFVSVDKDTNFDLIYKLKDDGIIENKSQNEYRLTNEGRKAANMGYDKYIQSLGGLEFQTIEKTYPTKAAATIQKLSIIRSKIYKWTDHKVIGGIILIVAGVLIARYFSS
jgi:predicted transcriptional regulator